MFVLLKVAALGCHHCNRIFKYP